MTHLDIMSKRNDRLVDHNFYLEYVIEPLLHHHRPWPLPLQRFPLFHLSYFCLLKYYMATGIGADAFASF